MTVRLYGRNQSSGPSSTENVPTLQAGGARTPEAEESYARLCSQSIGRFIGTSRFARLFIALIVSPRSYQDKGDTTKREMSAVEARREVERSAI